MKQPPVPSRDNITTNSNTGSLEKPKLSSSERTNLIREMEHWVDIGAALLAVRRNKTPCALPWRNRSDGLGYTEEEIFNLILENEAFGIALICGPTSGIVGIGCDTMDGGTLLRNTLIQMGIMPISYKSGKGIHFLFKNTDRLPHTCAKILPSYGEVDIRSADKGYLILPGSRHPSGSFYTWIDPPQFDENDQIVLPEVPEWLLSEIYKGTHKKWEPKECSDSENEAERWKHEFECNDQPTLDSQQILPSRIRKGCFMKLFRLSLPKQRWEKFTKHAASKTWILPGDPILEGTRYYAERAIGGLCATCYAHPTVAIQLLETFRYIFIPIRRNRYEELDTNRYVERLCKEEMDKQSDRNYDPRPPDKYLDPQKAGRYWYNLNRRQTYLEELVEEFYDERICHKRYGEALSEEGYVRFLALNFRSRLLYGVVRGISKLRAIFCKIKEKTTSYFSKGSSSFKNKPKNTSSNLSNNTSSTSTSKPSSDTSSKASDTVYNLFKTKRKVFGPGVYTEDSTPLVDLLSKPVIGRGRQGGTSRERDAKIRQDERRAGVASQISVSGRDSPEKMDLVS